MNERIAHCARGLKLENSNQPHDGWRQVARERRWGLVFGSVARPLLGVRFVIERTRRPAHARARARARADGDPRVFIQAVSLILFRLCSNTLATCWQTFPGIHAKSLCRILCRIIIRLTHG